MCFHENCESESISIRKSFAKFMKVIINTDLYIIFQYNSSVFQYTWSANA